MNIYHGVITAVGQGGEREEERRERKEEVEEKGGLEKK